MECEPARETTELGENLLKCHFVQITFGEEQKLRSFSLCHFLQSFVISSLFG
jgi:hypothetical protein